MKKYPLLFSFMFVFVILTACQKAQINTNDLKIDFSIDALIEDKVTDNYYQSTANNEYIASEGYYRLIKAFDYIKELIDNVNLRIDESTVDNELMVGQKNVHNGYEAIVKEEDDQRILNISHSESNLKLQLEHTNINDTKVVTGSYKIESSLFTFTFKDNNELIITLISGPSDSESYAHFINENGLLKGTVVFNNSEYDYHLYSVSNENNTAVFYDFISSTSDNHVFEVYDHLGNELYVSCSLKNQNTVGTGWHLKALDKIDGEEVIDHEDLHTIKLNYLNSDLERIYKDTIILGELSFTDDFSQIISVKPPFTSNTFENVRTISEKLNSYYKTEINK